MSAMAIVTFRQSGLHFWPSAPAERSYLGVKHRHLFYVRVMLPVEHDDREVEFHDLLAFSRHAFRTLIAMTTPYNPLDPNLLDFGDRSCEMLARALAAALQLRFPKRAVTVEVSEDGEVGALIILAAE